MRLFPVIAVMLIVALLLGACGPATPTTADEMTPSGQRFLLSLPRLEVEIGEDGQPEVAGLAIQDLTALAGAPQELSPALADTLAYYSNWMKLTDIQHLELVHTDKGIFLFANGEPLPYLVWDDESLANVGDAMSMLNVPYGNLVSLLAPIVERTGMNLVVRFPAQEGAAEIALRDPSTPPEPVPPTEVDPTAILIMDVDYDNNGIPSIAGVNTNELFSAAGMTVNSLALAPQTVDLLKANGVENVRIVSQDEGFFISVNDVPLPHVAWSGGQLANSAGLYGQMNPGSPFVELANYLVPQLGSVDVDMRLGFPAE